MPQHSHGQRATRLCASKPRSLGVAQLRQDTYIAEWQRLQAVPRTLMIPLVARALGSTFFPWLACEDADAARVLSRLPADMQNCLADLPTVLNILWRTQVIKETGRAFFALHPQAVGVNLGCGLANHFQWLDGGTNTWIDADLPEVMVLRRELLPQTSPRSRNACIDLACPGWWHRLGLPSGSGTAPVFILCEGVLLYLLPAQVQAVLQEFAQCAPPGSQWVCDVVSHLAVDQGHHYSSVGQTGAQFLWGVRRMEELVEPNSRLHILHARSVSECYGWAGMVAESLWCSWMGVPMYSMVNLGV